MSATSPPDGDRYILRSKIKVPMALATGRYEYLSDGELYDHLNDITAEARRRAEAAGKLDSGD